jgi:hypothetical protein
MLTFDLQVPEHYTGSILTSFHAPRLQFCVVGNNWLKDIRERKKREREERLREKQLKGQLLRENDLRKQAKTPDPLLDGTPEASPATQETFTSTWVRHVDRMVLLLATNRGFTVSRPVFFYQPFFLLLFG